MAINKKLIHFNEKSEFDKRLANNEILDTSIVFVKDSKEIWTHGQLYKCSDPDLSNYLTEEDLTEINEIISDIETALSNKAESSVLSNYATTEALSSGLSGKQATLVSGTNIKTIEGQSILGSGDIQITAAQVGAYTTGEIDTKVTAINNAINAKADPSSVTAVSDRVSTLENYFSTTEDVDTTINKWTEIVDFLDGVAEGSDVETLLADKANSSTVSALETRVTNLTTNNIAEGNNLYFTNARAVSALSNTLASYVPTSRTINGKNLTGNITLSASDVNAASAGELSTTNTNLANLTSTVNTKVDKVSGKGLSTNDFTTALKNKLDSLPTTFAPTNAEANVQADWNVTDSSSDAFIKNKPTIPTIPNLSGGSAAETGKYVSGVTVSGHTVTVTKGTLPTIPSVGNGTVTVTQNGTTVGSFTMNQSGNTTIALTDTNPDLSSYATQTWVNNQGFKKTDNNTTYTFANGTNGFTVTPSGGTAQTVTVTPSISAASTSANGLMTKDMVTKLNGISSGATAVSESTVSGWGFTKNTGTVTGVKINGATKSPSSGVVDLGTVITSHQSLAGKQDVISDLATIRSNASNGATAYGWGNHANAGYITEGVREYDCVGIPSDYITDHDEALNATLKDYVHTSKAVTINNVSASNIDDGKNYRIVFTKDGVPFVNVPWTDTNTDEKTGYASSSTNSDYPILFKPSTSSTTTAAKSAFNTYVTLNPSTRTLQVGSASSVLYYGKVQAGLGFFQTSDERLKDFGEDIKIDFDVLKSIPKKYFTWKDDEEKKSNIGTSAQAIQKIYPELVSDSDGTLVVDYNKLSVIALAAIDKLCDEKKALEERVERLEKLIEKLV